MGMNDTKHILLAGATGVLGHHITRALERAGYIVLALSRAPEAAVRADLLDRDQLLRAVEGLRIDTVVHAATALRSTPMRHKDMYATNHLRIAGTTNLMEAAQLVGARRVICESMVFGYGYRDFDGRVLTEEDPFAAPGDTAVEPHLEGMRVKERLMLGTPGIEGISLRYGLFYGAGGTENLVALLRKRQLPTVDDHGRVLPWVNLADAGTAVALAVEHGRPGQAYNIADDAPLGFGAHVEMVAETFDTPRPLRVPGWLMKPMSYAYRVTRADIRVSTAKAKAELGWKPQYPTVADGLRALVAPSA
ncbi:NAD-dependent epimerase/dehydratase family protein [Nocardia sp. NPDC050406]|uniref:NAD-dependent epimerase/dehydratase family protein n=1 Tax=Nocardia sp. NPDC050406 TaxID=3364318 RepID=UPI00378F45CC